MSKVSSVRREGAFRNSLPVTVRCKGTSTSKPQLHSIQPYYVPSNDWRLRKLHPMPFSLFEIHAQYPKRPFIRRAGAHAQSNPQSDSTVQPPVDNLQQLKRQVACKPALNLTLRSGCMWTALAMLISGVCCLRRTRKMKSCLQDSVDKGKISARLESLRSLSIRNP